jgi:hypothetical protein
VGEWKGRDEVLPIHATSSAHLLLCETPEAGKQIKVGLFLKEVMANRYIKYL